MSNSSYLENLQACVRYLTEERFGAKEATKARSEDGQNEDALFQTYRNLVNVREPMPANDSFLEAQDAMLQAKIAEAGITQASDLPRTAKDSRISIWRGDITTLAADAIVNAANSQMLGCWIPGHYCIDNAIHTFAGVQLRLECARIMRKQGHAEGAGQAKITPAYNLPSKYIIHTVGPIANGSPTEENRELLASCYTSCLDVASASTYLNVTSASPNAGINSADTNATKITSLAFCCISTGVFGFPQKEAAPIAVHTVREWLSAHNSHMHVIFNVFSEKDETIYKELLN